MILNIDWLNENGLRNYPIVDGASRESAAGAKLPNGLLVDLSMPVPVGTLEPDQAFIQRVAGFTTGVVITVADRSAPSTILASATVFLSSHQRYDSYPLVGQGSLAGSIGRVTVGDPKSVLEASGSDYDFSSAPDNSRLVTSVIRPLLRGLSSLVVESSDGVRSDSIKGNVVLRAGSNLSISVDETTNEITLSSGLLDPETTEDDCGCNPDESDDNCIRTINGVAPDSDGNFTIEGLECTEITSSGAGLVIDDSCTDPCCGCEQLETIYQSLQAVLDESVRLSEVSEQLRGRLDNLQNTMSNAALNPPDAADESGEISGTIWWYQWLD